MTPLCLPGVGDILITVVDGLTGFPDATDAVFPRTAVQTCIVHLIRNSMAFVSWKNRKRVMPGLKAIYRAESAAAAEAQLDAFEAEWGSRYPAVAPAWRRAWEHVVSMFAFPPAIRKMIYTTNTLKRSYGPLGGRHYGVVLSLLTRRPRDVPTHARQDPAAPTGAEATTLYVAIETRPCASRRLHTLPFAACPTAGFHPGPGSSPAPPSSMTAKLCS